jgi:hypothetical protein
MKPCFLCRQPGHTTMTCPHRVAPGVIGQRPPGAQAQGHSLLNLMRNREVSGVLPTRSLHMGAPKYQVGSVQQGWWAGTGMPHAPMSPMLVKPQKGSC